MTVYVYLQLQHDEMMIIRNKNKFHCEILTDYFTGISVMSAHNQACKTGLIAIATQTGLEIDKI